jgi:hypothetical protein
MATGSTPAKICVGDLVPELKKLPLTSAEASFDKRPRAAKRRGVGHLDPCHILDRKEATTEGAYRGGSAGFPCGYGLIARRTAERRPIEATRYRRFPLEPIPLRSFQLDNCSGRGHHCLAHPSTLTGALSF